MTKLNRRDFLKVYSLAGVAATAAGAGLAAFPQPANAAVPLGSKTSIDERYSISPDYRRMDQKNIVFQRMFWDQKTIDSKFENPKMIIETGKSFGAQFHGHKPNAYADQSGWSQLEDALSLASWSVDHGFAAASEFGVRNAAVSTDPPGSGTGLYGWDNTHKAKKQYGFKSPADASQHVKRAAKFLGADLVGLAPFNASTQRWVYSKWANGFPVMATGNPADFIHEDANFPFKPKSVVVMAFEMEYEAFKTAPSLIASSAAGLIYSKMAEASHKVATFIRQLGYNAIPCGNDTAMSVPMAIEAGLGEGSRMGMLVTEKYGPRVRLAKVFTDIELAPDHPIQFGVLEFCDACKKCADNCPGEAISQEDRMMIEDGQEHAGAGRVNISTNPGVKKWFMNGEKCFAFWEKNGGDCGTCIAVCPYNKIDEWHHDLTKLTTLTPLKPILRELDEFFGYGTTNKAGSAKNAKEIRRFWNTKVSTTK